MEHLSAEFNFPLPAKIKHVYDLHITGHVIPIPAEKGIELAGADHIIIQTSVPRIGIQYGICGVFHERRIIEERDQLQFLFAL